MTIVWLVAVVVALPFPRAVSLLIRVSVSPQPHPCYGGDNALSNTDILLTYGDQHNWPQRTTLKTFSSMKDQQVFDVNILGAFSNGVVYLFEQMEHGGGNCSCVRIVHEEIKVITTITHMITMCGGSASIPRRKEIIWWPGLPTGSFKIRTPQPIPYKQPPLHQECSNAPYIEISFVVAFQRDSRTGCNTINSFSEGIEFSYQLSSKPNEWVPTNFIYFDDRVSRPDIFIGSSSNFSIRGYRWIDVINNTTNLIKLKLCGFSSTDSIRFRWLQTSQYTDISSARKVWTLDDIVINLINQDLMKLNLLDDNFNETNLNPQIWPENQVRNAELGSCGNYSEALIFGLNASMSQQTIVSTGLVTNDYSLSSSVSSPNPDGSVSNISSCSVNDNIVSITNFLFILEENTKCKISSSNQLSMILKDIDTSDSLQSVESLIMRSSDIDVVTQTYLLGVQITRLSDISLTEALIEETVTLGIHLLSTLTSTTSRVLIAISTTILTLQDSLLAAVSRSQIIQSSNFVLFSRLVDLNSINSTIVTAINSSDFSELIGPLTTLTIPVVLLRAFDDGDGIIQINSAIYRNVSSIFSYQLNESSFLGPDIVASSIQCGRSLCNTSSYILNSSFVTITFEHSEIIKNDINLNNMETSCVFLEIMESNSTILKIGEWSDRGCTKNLNMSSVSVTVCECNHLTHFGILLSPKPPQLSPRVKLSLSIISYIGVAVSVVAMSFTIMTFVVFKSLHNMRNYIHVNLCISLALGQILFVAGVDRTGSSEDGSVPLHCQVIAVFLHYFFLVSFMWMLMEGVILYVTIVRVFVKNKRYYVISFTCVSYGLPIVCMGFLTLPLGFGLSMDNYGYDRACFLNANNHFIWAIIAPFIVIFLANVTFFVMTARIMWQQQLKQIQKSKYEMIRGWLRSAVSLLVIMSLTWIIGILVLEVEKLIPLVYIYTIMVALQGFFIFLIFVVFSKSVQESYTKWWRFKIHSDGLYHSANVNSSRGINLEAKKDSNSSHHSRPQENVVTNTKPAENDKNSINSNDYALNVPHRSVL